MEAFLMGGGIMLAGMISGFVLGRMSAVQRQIPSVAERIITRAVSRISSKSSPIDDRDELDDLMDGVKKDGGKNETAD